MDIRQRLQYATLAKVAEYASRRLAKLANAPVAATLGSLKPGQMLQSAGPGPAPVGSPLAPQYVGPDFSQTPQVPHIGLQGGLGLQPPVNPLSQIPSGQQMLQPAGTQGQLNRAALGGRLPVPNPQQGTPRGASLPRPAAR